MGKEQKTRTEKLEKHAPETQPMIICEVKTLPRMRSVRSKVKAASKTKTTTARVKTTFEKSGNVMKLCVNLMPVLASAKEEEEDEEEEEETCSRRETCERTLDPGLDRTTETRRTRSPRCVLPPITKPVEAEEHLRNRRRHSPLPDIGLTERVVAMTTKTRTARNRDQGSGTREELDHRAWMDKPLSNTRSDEFGLPDISLSSLETLLQTVTEKLGRRKRSDDEEPWRRFRSDRLLVVDHLKEKRRKEHCPEESNPAPVVNRHKSLPPLIFAMTKKNPPI
ncbi:uncharacterized protein LOC115417467 [Sphaeramia orbicularis]|uniref:uncharacterized protein LOC115417467 n=1 Tax=Sphaeramia orbicularis TaxID=375764 RepID=UPI00118121DB|nr:uncharacterized protein LOC115417467 [Sphaeramia orbicularis]